MDQNANATTPESSRRRPSVLDEDEYMNQNTVDILPNSRRSSAAVSPRPMTSSTTTTRATDATQSAAASSSAAPSTTLYSFPVERGTEVDSGEYTQQNDPLTEPTSFGIYGNRRSSAAESAGVTTTVANSSLGLAKKQYEDEVQEGNPVAGGLPPLVPPPLYGYNNNNNNNLDESAGGLESVTAPFIDSSSGSSRPVTANNSSAAVPNTYKNNISNDNVKEGQIHPVHNNFLVKKNFDESQSGQGFQPQMNVPGANPNTTNNNNRNNDNSAAALPVSYALAVSTHWGEHDSDNHSPGVATAPMIEDSWSPRVKKGETNWSEPSGIDAHGRRRVSSEEDPYTTNYTYAPNPNLFATNHYSNTQRHLEDDEQTINVDTNVNSPTFSQLTRDLHNNNNNANSANGADGEDDGMIMAENERDGDALADPEGTILVPSQISAGPLDPDELQLARLSIYNDTCPVSTMDFLKDTTDTLLPDSVNNFFNNTSEFLKDSADIFKQLLPSKMVNAFQVTGKGLSIMAEYTGDVLGNVPEYIAKVIPEHLMSKETQQLILIDFLSVLKCYLNFEILFVPYIFRKGGLVTGILLVLVTNVISFYTSVAFYEAKNQLKDAAQVVMYADVMRLTWGKNYPMFSTVYNTFYFICFELYSALNGQYLLRRMGLTEHRANVVVSYLIPSLFALPLIFMKRARTQLPLGSLVSLLVFICAIIIMTLFDFSSDIRTKFGAMELWPADVVDFFTALGLTLFIFSPLRRTVPIERGMHPNRFLKLSLVCSAISLLFYFAFGLTTFLYYKTSTCSVLPLSFGGSAREVAVSALLFFAFVFVIPQSLFPITEVCDRRILGLRRLPTYWQFKPNLMRLLFLAGGAIVASAVPYFGVLLALSGSFGCGFITLLVPAALDYVRRERADLVRGRRLRWWEYIIVALVGLLGVVVVTVGILFGMYDMWRVTQVDLVHTC